jgi:uncharacterized protein YidB (DUF937 family)
MGLLDDLAKSLGAGAPGGQPQGGAQAAALVQALTGLLAGGGLQQLIASFQRKGLGDVVGSWVSTGANMPVTPDQIGRALDQDQLARLAQQAGLDVGSVTRQLSGLLPEVVDRLTPDGDVPAASALQERLGGLLKGIL